MVARSSRVPPRASSASLLNCERRNTRWENLLYPPLMPTSCMCAAAAAGLILAGRDELSALR